MGEGFPLAAAAAAVDTAAAAYAPADMWAVATDLGQLPEVFASVALALRTWAAHLEGDCAIEQPVIAEIQQLYAGLVQLAQYAQEIEPLFRRIHAEDLKRGEQPRTGEAGWNIAPTSGGAGAGPKTTTEVSERVSNPTPVPEGYAAEAAAIRATLADAPCPYCNRGAADHTFLPDEAGHAHAWCNFGDAEAPIYDAAEAAAIRATLADAPCPYCNRGAADHTFLPDEAGHAHAWCNFGDAEAPNPFAGGDRAKPSELSTGPVEDAEPAAVTAAPIGHRMSDAPLIENRWGIPEGNPVVNYHKDGAIGMAVARMGRDAHLDIDGDALANVLGRIATDAVVGRITSQQALDQLRQVYDRLPESAARRELAGAIHDLDAPDTPPPALPAETPPALRQLVTDLHAVPLVRRDPTKEEEPLVAIIDGVMAPRGGVGLRTLRELRSLQNRRHESKEGKFEIDRAIARAVQALEDERRRNRA